MRYLERPRAAEHFIDLTSRYIPRAMNYYRSRIEWFICHLDNNQGAEPASWPAVVTRSKIALPRARGIGENKRGPLAAIEIRSRDLSDFRERSVSARNSPGPTCGYAARVRPRSFLRARRDKKKGAGRRGRRAGEPIGRVILYHFPATRGTLINHPLGWVSRGTRVVRVRARPTFGRRQ